MQRAATLFIVVAAHIVFGAVASDADCLCEVCPCTCSCFDRFNAEILFVPTYGSVDYPAEQNFRYGVHQAAKDFRVRIVEQPSGKVFSVDDAIDFLRARRNDPAVAGLITGSATAKMTSEVRAFLDARRTFAYVGGGTSPSVVEELRGREGAIIGMDAGGTTVNDGRYRGHLYHVGQDEVLAAKLLAEQLLVKGVQKMICVVTDAASPTQQERCAAVERFMTERGLASVYRKVNLFSISATFRDEWYKSGGFFDPAFAGEYGVIVDRVQSLLLAIGHQGFDWSQIGYFKRAVFGVFDPAEGAVRALEDGSSGDVTGQIGGKVAATVDAQFYLQGYLAVAFLYSHEKTTQAPNHDLTTGPILITKEVPSPLPKVRGDSWFSAAPSSSRSFRTTRDHLAKASCRDAGYPVCAPGEDPALAVRYPEVSVPTPACPCIDREQAIRYKILHSNPASWFFSQHWSQAYEDLRQAFGVSWERMDVRIATSGFGQTQDPPVVQRYDDIINDPSMDDWGIIGDPYFPTWAQWKELAKSGRPIFPIFELPLPYDEHRLSDINVTVYSGHRRCSIVYNAGIEASQYLKKRRGVTFNPWHHEFSFSWNHCFVDAMLGLPMETIQWSFPPQGDREAETGDWRTFSGTCGDGSNDTCKASIAFTQWVPGAVGPNIAEPVYELMRRHPDIDVVMMPEQDPQVVPYTLEAIQRADIENGHPGQTTLIPVGGTQSSIAALMRPLPGLREEYTLGSMGDSQPYLQGFAAGLSAALYDSTLRGEVLLRDIASSRTLRSEDAGLMKRRVECEVWGAETFKAQNYAPDPVDFKLRGFVFFPVCNYSRCGGEALPCSGHGRCVQRGDLFNSSTNAHCECDPSYSGEFCQFKGIWCAAGFEVDEATSTCQPCGHGTFQPTSGPSRRCGNCSAGRAAGRVGQTECEACEPGKYSGEGQRVCDRCAVQFFANTSGSTACESCENTLAGSTTLFQGAASEKDCTCPAGARLLRTTSCISCPVEGGLVCPDGGRPPLLAPGWYLPPGAPVSEGFLDLYECTSEEMCPGQVEAGDPICGQNRDSNSINCGQCVEGYFSTAGSCRECGGESSAILPLFALFCFLAYGVFAWKMERKAEAVELMESVLLSVTVGDTVFFLQSLGIFAGMAIRWPEAFQAIIEPLKLLLLDISVLRVPCVIPQTLASAYISRLSLPLLLILVAGMWYMLSVPLFKLSRGRFPRFTKAASFNNVGMILQALFISLVKSVASLVTCFGGTINGKRTIRSYPWVVCWESEHLAMLPVFMLGALLTVVLVAALVYVIYIAPSAYVKKDFKIASRFVVFKFHTRAYWFGVVILLRSLCLGLVEVLEPDNPFMQVILMQATLGASLMMHLVYLPYHDEYGNKLEAIELCLMILMLSAGNYFNDPRDMSDSFSIFMRDLLIALFSIAAASVALTGLYAAYLLRRPQLVEKRNRKLVNTKFDKLVSISHVILAKEAPEVEQVLSHASYIDRWHLSEVVNFLSLELLGIRSKSLSEKRLPQVAMEVSNGDVEDLKSQAVRLSRYTSQGSLRNSFSKGTLVEDDGREIGGNAADCVDV